MDQASQPLLEPETGAALNNHVYPNVRLSRASRTNSIRRGLMLIFITACFILMCMYWMPSETFYDAYSDFKSGGIPDVPDVPEYPIFKPDVGIVHGTAVPFAFSNDSKPQWTWTCRDNTCKRIQATDTDILSLATCSMFCGPPQLWPLPTGHITLSKDMVPVDTESIKLKVENSPSEEVTEYLSNAFDLFIDDLRRVAVKVTIDGVSGNSSMVTPVHEIVVHIDVKNDRDPLLRLDTDESYELSLKPVKDSYELAVEITAASFCGARHGLETLSQLIWPDPFLKSLMAYRVASVKDAPKFKYRGLLLDTSRHYFPVKDLMRTIDAMGANKLNTFHWHATDSQSFPLAFRSAPQLTRYGAYGPDAVYTRHDIAAVVRRARLRGVRVVIEIDAPAHVGSAFSWGPAMGKGELAYCIDHHPWQGMCGQPPCGQLNPTNSHVYELLEAIYAEIIELTGVKDVFHLGGDEVNPSCWKKYLRINDPKELWLDFMEKSYAALERANGGKAPELVAVWSSKLTQAPYLSRLDRSKYAIQAWGASQWPDQAAILNAGYRTIVSHVNAWYLDCGVGSYKDSSFGHCGPYRKVAEVYNHRPWGGGSDRWRVVGGVACQWTELLSPDGLDGRLWPRGAALAERLWADPEHGATAEALVRLDGQRARLVARGVAAEPLWPRWCTENPMQCIQ